MTETLITVDVPTFDSSTITGLPDYTTIDNISYTGSNFFEVLNQIKTLLINESTGTTSNFMRASGNQIIVGSKQFSNVVVVPNLNAQGGIIDDGTLTCHAMAYLQAGCNIANNVHAYDSSGNLTVNSITISPVEFSKLKYCNTLTGNVQSQLDSLNSNKEGIIFNVDGSGNLTITSSTASTTVNSLICSSINGISSTNLGYFDINSSLTTLLSNKQNVISNISYFDISSSLTTLLSNKQNVISNISYFDISSSLTTLLSNKQNVISNISYFDISSSLTSLLNTINTNITTNTTNISTNTSSITTINTTLSNKQNIISNISYFDISSSLTSLLNAKQNTISNISYFDISSRLTTLLNAKQNTVSNISYFDISSSLTTLLSGKQSSITTSTNLSFNNLTVAGTISIPNSSISTSAINGYVAPSSLLSSANTWTNTQTFAGISTTGETDSGTMTISGQTTVAQMAESFSSTTGSSSPFTISYASGSVFYIPSDYSTGLSSNFNIKITNIPLQTAASRTYTLTIIYKNANKVYCNGLIIQDTSNAYLCSSAVSTYITPLYSGGTVPTISASNIICQTFTIIYMLNSSGTLTYTQCITSVNSFA